MDRKKDVYDVIEEISGAAVKEETQRLDSDLGFDSLKMVLLLILLEERFAMELNESDMNPFALETVADVMALVCRYKGEET